MTALGHVLAPRGCLAVVEFKKMDGPPGPPQHIRLSAAELEQAMAPYGFSPKSVDEVGPYHYLTQFSRSTLIPR